MDFNVVGIMGYLYFCTQMTITKKMSKHGDFPRRSGIRKYMRCEIYPLGN